MQEVVMKGNTVETVAWPEKCPRCGADFREGDTKEYFHVKVRKGIRAYFVRSKLKKISVKLCSKCSE